MFGSGGWFVTELDFPVLSWLYQTLFGEPLTILGQSHGTCTGQGEAYSENNSYLLPPSV